MSRRMWILTAAALVPVVAVGCASMQTMKPEEAIDARQKLMKGQGEAWKAIQEKTKAGDVAAVVPEAEKLRDTAKTGNTAATQQVVSTFGRQACGTCHTPFRVPPKQS